MLSAVKAMPHISMMQKSRTRLLKACKPEAKLRARALSSMPRELTHTYVHDLSKQNSAYTIVRDFELDATDPSRERIF